MKTDITKEDIISLREDFFAFSRMRLYGFRTSLTIREIALSMLMEWIIKEFDYVSIEDKNICFKEVYAFMGKDFSEYV